MFQLYVEKGKDNQSGFKGQEWSEISQENWQEKSTNLLRQCLHRNQTVSVSSNDFYACGTICSDRRLFPQDIEPYKKRNYHHG